MLPPEPNTPLTTVVIVLLENHQAHYAVRQQIGVCMQGLPQLESLSESVSVDYQGSSQELTRDNRQKIRAHTQFHCIYKLKLLNIAHI